MVIYNEHIPQDIPLSVLSRGEELSYISPTDIALK